MSDNNMTNSAAGDVEALAKVLAEHGAFTGYDSCRCGWRAERSGWNPPAHQRHVAEAVANHVAAAREADRADLDALVEHYATAATNNLYALKAARAEVERLRALADTYLEEHDKQHARAEAADERLAGLVARVTRALDDEEANLADDGARLSHSVVRRFRALLTTADTTALDAVRREAYGEALTGALHPEFGTEWRGPDGTIWKAIQQAKAEERERIARHTPENN